MKKLALILLAAFVLVGCSEESEPTLDPPSKDEVRGANGKSDSADINAICEEHDLEPGCDPCKEFGWYDDGKCDLFCVDHDQDCGDVLSEYNFSITYTPGFSGTIKTYYQANSDSFWCTDRVWDMGSLRTVPEQFDEMVAPDDCVTEDNGDRLCVYTFPHLAGDGCDSKIRHIYLNPMDEAGTMEPWASLSFVDKEEYQNEVQEIFCEESNGLMMCGNDLYYHTVDGRAQLKLSPR